jgi:hypothetical protein
MGLKFVCSSAYIIEIFKSREESKKTASINIVIATFRRLTIVHRVLCKRKPRGKSVTKSNNNQVKVSNFFIV